MKRRGPSHRLSPEERAFAFSLGVADFARHANVSPRVVRRWIEQGLPVIETPKTLVLRAQGEAWIRRTFERPLDRASIVDTVLEPFRAPKTVPKPHRIRAATATLTD